MKTYISLYFVSFSNGMSPYPVRKTWEEAPVAKQIEYIRREIEDKYSSAFVQAKVVHMFTGKETTGEPKDATMLPVEINLETE